MNGNNHTARRVAQQYTRVQIRTAGIHKRLCLLHERCTQLVSMGIKCGGSRRRVLLNKAQNILARLQAALKIEDEVSQGLFYLYDYVYVSLEKASGGDLINAYKLLISLNEMFTELQRS